MKIIEKHTYSIDIIELKLGLDDIINNSPNINKLTTALDIQATRTCPQFDTIYHISNMI